MVKRVFFGPESEMVQKYAAKGGLDLNAREWAIMLPFVILIFVMGLAPNMFLKYTQPSLDHLLNNRSKYELQVKSEETSGVAIVTKETK
jgi:NADH-quinone oxidoreductase subunit M